MAALGARIARYHDGLAPIRDGFGRPDDYRHSVAADIRQMREQGERLDPPTSEALAEKMPAALEPFIDLVARRVAAGAIRRCHGDLHLRNIVLIDGSPVPFDAIEFSERIANIDVLYDLSFALMDLCERRLRPLANRLLNEWLWRVAELPGASHEEALALLPMFLSRRASIRAFVDAQAAAVSGADTTRARDYQRVALSFLQPAQPRLMAIGGLSGSGKTTTALPPCAGGRPDARAPSWCAATSSASGGPASRWRSACRRAATRSEASAQGSMPPRSSAPSACCGRATAPSSTRCSPGPRNADAAEALARRVGVAFEGVWLDVPKEVAQSRIAGRRGDASDATPAVVERQFGYDLGEIRWRRA
jgi:Ser/Thr protein kinase RdoA (MazF antagonist)